MLPAAEAGATSRFNPTSIGAADSSRLLPDRLLIRRRRLRAHRICQPWGTLFDPSVLAVKSGHPEIRRCGAAPSNTCQSRKFMSFSSVTVFPEEDIESCDVVLLYIEREKETNGAEVQLRIISHRGLCCATNGMMSDSGRSNYTHHSSRSQRTGNKQVL